MQRWGGGPMQKQHSQLWPSSWNWSCGALTTIILIVLSTVNNLQFQGRFVPISLRPILGIVAAYVMTTVWSSCSSRLPPGGGFSIYETAHRTWLRIGSIALGEELKVLDSVYFILFFYFYLFIYLFLTVLGLRFVRGLSLVAASGDRSSSRCAGLSLSWPLPLRSTGSRRTGSVAVAHGPSCSVACGIFPDQGLNPCPLH